MTGSTPAGSGAALRQSQPIPAGSGTALSSPMPAKLWHMSPLYRHVWENSIWGWREIQEIWKGKQNAWKRTLLRTWRETCLWKKAFHDKGDAAHRWPTPGLQVAFGMAITLGRTTDHARAEENEAAARTGRAKQDIWEWQTVLYWWPSLSLCWRDWERMTAMHDDTKGNWD